jgi:MFS family permease
VFYGWWVVAACFAMLVIASGIGFYGFSLFVGPLEDAFGWSRGLVMTGLTVYYIAQAIVSPFLGRLVDRHGAPKVMAVGAVVSGASLLALSQTHALWYFYACNALLGAGHVTLGHVPGSVVVFHWFDRRRGTAIGVMGVGVGVGGFAMAPLLGAWLIPALGWRWAYIVVGIGTVAVALPLALFVIRTRPSDMGLWPDGSERPAVEAAPGRPTGESAGLSLRRAATTSALWLMCLSFLALHTGLAGMNQNAVPYLEDVGFSSGRAAAVLSLVGLMSAVGKFLFGWLCDRIFPKHAAAIGIALAAVGVGILMQVDSASAGGWAWTYAVIMGLGVGSWLPGMSMVTSRTFGLASYGAIWGVVTSVQAVGAAVGPTLLATIHDRVGHYRSAFVVVLGLYAVALVGIVLVRRPRWPEEEG